MITKEEHKIVKKIYDKNREENKEYFIDAKGNRFYLPLDGELLHEFMRRILTKIKYEAMNSDKFDFKVVKVISNPFRDYALLEFYIDSRHDLSEAIDKYKIARKKLSDSLMGGE